MKNMLLAFLLTFCFVCNSGAEIYKWVDERGITHYGDSVPSEYKNKAKPAGIISINPTAAEQSAALRRLEEQKALSQQQKERQLADDKNKGAAGIKDTEQKNKGSSATPCEQAWEAYFESYACFGPYHLAGGGIKPEAFTVCKQVSEPSCPRTQ